MTAASEDSKNRTAYNASPPENGEPLSDPVTDKAKEAFGVRYLYPFQRLAVHNILGAGSPRGEEDSSPGDQIILLPTGAGKSLCFQLPALILPGITLVIYPLLSLMADQKRRLDGAGIPSRVLRGGQDAGERQEIWDALRSGKVKFLITNPETLGGEEVLRRCAALCITHLVIDEAHCVTEWGESFRPAYLEVGKIREALAPRVTTAFTATASPPILEGIVKHLFGGRRPHVISGNPDRPNISYSVLPVLSKDEALAELLSELPRPALVFCSSRPGTEMTARYLRRRLGETEIFFYHAGLEREEKKDAEKWFFASKNGILAATCAYGMGVDKADIRTVIHRDIPPSGEAYLQESGRAGRDGKQSAAILLTDAGTEKRETGAATGRRAAMTAYGQTETCRRKYLLSLLGAETDSCGSENRGCDICAGTRVSVPPEENLIISFIKRNPRRFTAEEAALILSGAGGARAVTGGYTRISGFGSLSRWEEGGVREALAALVRQKKIRKGEGFFFRNRLSLQNRAART